MLNGIIIFIGWKTLTFTDGYIQVKMGQVLGKQCIMGTLYCAFDR